MNYQNLRRLSGPFLISLFILLITSCEQDVTEPAFVQDADATTIARAAYSTRTVNFNNRTDGTYTSTEAVSDFGNASGWNDARAYNSGGTCRIAVLKNALGSGSGMLSQVDLPDGAGYELKFDARYHSLFEWGRGGKVGFGLSIGEGNTGCDKADDGNGGSLRIMWYQSDAGRVTLRPYAYYKDMPETCGDRFGVSYPSTGSISRSTWYTITLTAKSNSGSSTNGIVKVDINGTTLVNKSIRWTTNDANRLIKKILFHTFRGGSTSDWEASTDSYIYYDNVSWKPV